MLPACNRLFVEALQVLNKRRDLHMGLDQLDAASLDCNKQCRQLVSTVIYRYALLSSVAHRDVLVSTAVYQDVLAWTVANRRLLVPTRAIWQDESQKGATDTVSAPARDPGTGE